MYAKVIDGQVAQYPYSLSQLKTDNPNVSFPDPLDDANAAAFCAVRVTPTQQPSYDGITQNCTEEVPRFVDGALTQVWVVTDATAEEIAQRTSQMADEVRTQRNNLLSASDWTMLPDAPTDHQAWASYRQQLRDVTNQPGFPLNVIWPEPPAA